MKELHFDSLSPVVAKRFAPFAGDILEGYGGIVHSLHIVGSAVTHDFREKSSVIHSVIVISRMDFGFIRFIASLGRKYAKKGIAAPLIMTPDQIQSSLDAFPVEFHDFRLIHRTVFGDDIFSGITVENGHLRLQCERDAKAKLIGLRQSYLSSLGDRKRLIAILSQSIIGCMPLLRALVFLLGKEPPVKRLDAIRVFQEMTSIDARIFETLLSVRAKSIKPSKEEINHIFERYYAVLEEIVRVVDDLQQENQ